MDKIPSVTEATFWTVGGLNTFFWPRGIAVPSQEPEEGRDNGRELNSDIHVIRGLEPQCHYLNYASETR